MALQNVYSKGFKSVNLFEVSLIEDVKPDAAFYMDRFFMMFKMSPQVDGKFSPKENGISLKVSLEKALAFATSLRQMSYDKKIGAFTIFSDLSKSQYANGSTEKKSCSVSQFNQDVKTNNGVIQHRKISVSIASSNKQKPLNISMFPEEGVAMARYIEFIAEKGIEKEFEFKSSNRPKYSNNGNSQKMDAPMDDSSGPFSSEEMM